MRHIILVWSCFLFLGCASAPQLTPTVVPVVTPLATKEESQQVAYAAVQQTSQFKDNGRNIILIEVVSDICTYCWKFHYRFTAGSQQEPRSYEAWAFVTEKELTSLQVEEQGKQTTDEGEIICDATIQCPPPLTCIKFLDKAKPICSKQDPCSYLQCASNQQCIVMESYPPQVGCVNK